MRRYASRAYLSLGITVIMRERNGKRARVNDGDDGRQQEFERRPTVQSQPAHDYSS